MPIHKMKLVRSAYDTIRDGVKTIEMRLNDSKRSSVIVGDEIEFECREDGRRMRCAVVGLDRYADFFELYAAYDKTAIGYGEGESADANDMYVFYSPEDIAEYGVLAIGVRFIADI